MMNFTNDEMNLMCIYQSDSRSGLIAALTEMRGYLDEDEAELRELTDSALQKLSEITDEDFAALDLVPDFDPDESGGGGGSGLRVAPVSLCDSISQNRKNIDFGK